CYCTPVCSVAAWQDYQLNYHRESNARTVGQVRLVRSRWKNCHRDRTVRKKTLEAAQREAADTNTRLCVVMTQWKVGRDVIALARKRGL
ncbi:hypothetical protein, partial [Bacillus subtilis]|uniref:hypothetical protein n=1 Tax=Bacillus subtilis TaxID=1423 RepID=UPI003C19CE26